MRQDCFHFSNPNPRRHPEFEVMLKDWAENQHSTKRKILQKHSQPVLHLAPKVGDTVTVYCQF